MSVEQELSQALTFHQQGDFQAARDLYVKVLEKDPRQPDAHHLLGVLAFQLKQYEPALTLIQKSIEFKSNDASYYSDLGTVLHEMKRYDEACRAYEEALKLKPNTPEIMNNYGVTLKDIGRFEEAVANFKKAIREKPDYVDPQYNLGIAYYENSKLNEALQQFRKVLVIHPHHMGASKNLGIVLQDTGQLEESETLLCQVLNNHPDDPETLNALGNTYVQLGKTEKAVTCFEKAVALAPNDPKLYNHLGMAYLSKNRLDDALKMIQRSLEIEPNYVPSLKNLASILNSTGKIREAKETLTKAIDIQPDEFEVLNDLAYFHAKLGDLDGAARLYEQAVQKGYPHSYLWRLKSNSLCPSLMVSDQAIETYRQNLDRSVNDIKRQIAESDTLQPNRLMTFGCPPPFFLPYHGVDDRPVKEMFAHIHESLLASSIESKTCQPLMEVPHQIHLGFVVTDDHEVIFAKLMGGLIAQLSKEKFRISVFCRGLGQQILETHLPSTEGIHFSQLPMMFEQMVDHILATKPHVLYYFEAGSDPINYFLPFYRLAPVQCASWGTPETTGITNMNYYISSELIESEGSEAHYSEKLVQLPTFPAFYTRLTLPDLPVPRSHFGLKEQTNVYGCLQSFYKIHPQMDSLFAQILEQDPEGELILLEGMFDGWDQLFRERLRKSLGESLFQRVRFQPKLSRQDFVGLLSCVDVLLDPIHFGSGNTMFEGFMVGTPIVTWPGEFMRGRIVSGAYKKMGINAPVASSFQEYVQKAITIATDKNYQQEIRDQILQTQGVLFEEANAVTSFEEACYWMCEQVSHHR